MFELALPDQPDAKAIAYDVGYEDAGFFTRLFRRKVTLTPSAYRKRFGSMRRALQGTENPSKSFPH